jgi:hypothetical protein
MKSTGNLVLLQLFYFNSRWKDCEKEKELNFIFKKRKKKGVISGYLFKVSSIRIQTP